MFSFKKFSEILAKELVEMFLLEMNVKVLWTVLVFLVEGKNCLALLFVLLLEGFFLFFFLILTSVLY